MNAELIKKYSQPIEDAVDYIEERRTRSRRKGWTDRQRKMWKLRNPLCPLCNQIYTKDNNITKEHIHPLVIGGYEDDANIMSLCHMCNKVRNDIMIGILGSSQITKIRERWPEIKPPLREFLMWCHASVIDDNENDISQFPDLNTAFAQKRNISFQKHHVMFVKHI